MIDVFTCLFCLVVLLLLQGFTWLIDRRLKLLQESQDRIDLRVLQLGDDAIVNAKDLMILAKVVDELRRKADRDEEYAREQNERG